MFYTNGKIIIHSLDDLDALNEAQEKIVSYLKKEEGMKAEFVFSEEHKYPMYIVPEGVEYKHMEEVLRPNIKLRAINEDMVVLNDKHTVNVKYNYTDEEMDDIAKRLASDVLEMHSLEEEKKALMAEYKAKIDTIDNRIFDSSKSCTQGFEFRDYQTRIKLNFADKKRYYVDINEPDTIRKTEDMQKGDFQMRIDHEFEERIEPKKEKGNKVKGKKGAKSKEVKKDVPKVTETKDDTDGDPF